MDGRLTYLDMERLVVRARINGQEGIAFHLAMARDVLLKEEFGSCLEGRPEVIESVVREELDPNDRLRAIKEGR
jgi:hypothetical protein